MELRQLEYFVAVAEEANFTRAAQRIHVAQPAVSAQIQRLERELGQPLLDRSRRTVRLTAAGEAALPYARAALAAVADIHVAVEELTQLVRGTVAIGTVTSHSVDMPSLLADFHADHPEVEITLSTDSSDTLIEMVRTGRLDAAIVSVGPGERPEGLDVEVVTDEAIAAAVSPDRRTGVSKDHPADRFGRPAAHRATRRGRHPASVRRRLRQSRGQPACRVRGQHTAGARRPCGARTRGGDRARIGTPGPRRVARAADRPGTAGPTGAGLAVGRPDEPGCPRARR